MVVSNESLPFYRSYANHQDYVDLSVTSKAPTKPTSDVTVVEQGIEDSIDSVPSKILVTRTMDNADRFYLYKKSS